MSFDTIEINLVFSQTPSYIIILSSNNIPPPLFFDSIFKQQVSPCLQQYFAKMESNGAQ